MVSFLLVLAAIILTAILIITVFGIVGGNSIIPTCKDCNCKMEIYRMTEEYDTFKCPKCGKEVEV